MLESCFNMTVRNSEVHGIGEYWFPVIGVLQTVATVATKRAALLTQSLRKHHNLTQRTQFVRVQQPRQVHGPHSK